MQSGFYVVGKVLGYRVDRRVNQSTGEERTRYFMGMELQEPNGYGGFNTSTQEIRVDDKSFNDGFKNMVEKMKQKIVMALVRPREWAMENGRTGIVYTLDENSTIEEVK